MSCKTSCKLCKNLIISTSVVWNGTNVVVTIPEGNYLDNNKYCIVVAQPVPLDATIGASVLVQIGTGTQTYPLVKCNCRPFLAKDLSTRVRYSTIVETTPTTATFKMLGNPCCQPNNNLRSVNGTVPTIATEGGV